MWQMLTHIFPWRDQKRIKEEVNAERWWGNPWAEEEKKNLQAEIIACADTRTSKEHGVFKELHIVVYTGSTGDGWGAIEERDRDNTKKHLYMKPRHWFDTAGFMEALKCS